MSHLKSTGVGESLPPLRIRCCSWNAGNAPPPAELEAWLQTEGDYDIIVVAAQESSFSLEGGKKATYLNLGKDLSKQMGDGAKDFFKRLDDAPSNPRLSQKGRGLSLRNSASLNEVILDTDDELKEIRESKVEGEATESMEGEEETKIKTDRPSKRDSKFFILGESKSRGGKEDNSGTNKKSTKDENAFSRSDLRKTVRNEGSKKPTPVLVRGRSFDGSVSEEKVETPVSPGKKLLQRGKNKVNEGRKHVSDKKREMFSSNEENSSVDTVFNDSDSDNESNVSSLTKKYENNQENHHRFFHRNKSKEEDLYISDDYNTDSEKDDPRDSELKPRNSVSKIIKKIEREKERKLDEKQVKRVERKIEKLEAEKEKEERNKREKLETLGKKVKRGASYTNLRGAGADPKDQPKDKEKDKEKDKDKDKDKRKEEEEDWYCHLQKVMGQKYVILEKIQLLEIRLAVYINIKIADTVNITELSKGLEGTGIGSVVGNKGGCAIRFCIGNQSLAFVGSHLAAHEGKEFRLLRNSNVKEIFKELKLAKDNSCGFHNQTDHVFWLGDLNYRLDCNLLLDKPRMESHEDRWNYIHKLVLTKNIPKLLEYDELLDEMKHGRIFYGFKEAKIEFLPTFKVEREPNELSHIYQRVPSYCDRILWHSRKGNNDVTPIKYGSVKEIGTSDHKPIFCDFEVAQSTGPPQSLVPKKIAESEPCPYVMELKSLIVHFEPSAKKVKKDVKPHDDLLAFIENPVASNKTLSLKDIGDELDDILDSQEITTELRQIADRLKIVQSQLYFREKNASFPKEEKEKEKRKYRLKLFSSAFQEKYITCDLMYFQGTYIPENDDLKIHLRRLENVHVRVLIEQERTRAKKIVAVCDIVTRDFEVGDTRNFSESIHKYSVLLGNLEGYLQISKNSSESTK